jgi:sulfonate transport system substrate-binding protein
MRGIFGRHVLFAAAIACALPMSPAASADPVKIRAGWINTPGELMPVLFLKAGIGQNLDKTYHLEAQRFAASPSEVTALATGDLDMAGLSYSSFSIAIENAHLNDLRVVADEIQDGVPGHATAQYMVLKDSPIKAVADAKGKVVATNGAGSGMDMGMRFMLLSKGLRDKKDYSLIEAPFPNMKAMLTERKIDLGTFVLPFAYDPDLLDKARVLFTLHDSVDITELSFITAREGFIAKNRAAVVDFFTDMLRAQRWYLDPANHAEAMNLIGEYLKIPPERLSYVFTNRDYYRDPDGLPNLPALTKNIHAQKELGFIANDLDAEKYADLGPIKEAAQRLK